MPLLLELIFFNDGKCLINRASLADFLKKKLYSIAALYRQGIISQRKRRNLKYGLLKRSTVFFKKAVSEIDMYCGEQANLDAHRMDEIERHLVHGEHSDEGILNVIENTNVTEDYFNESDYHNLKYFVPPELTKSRSFDTSADIEDINDESFHRSDYENMEAFQPPTLSRNISQQSTDQIVDLADQEFTPNDYENMQDFVPNELQKTGHSLLTKTLSIDSNDDILDVDEEGFDKNDYQNMEYFQPDELNGDISVSSLDDYEIINMSDDLLGK